MRQRTTMTSPRTIHLYVFMVAFAALGAPAVMAQYRPVPVQHQEYHKHHKYLPGYAVTSSEVIHTPNFDDPMCCECTDCRGVHGRPLMTLAELYHTRWSPKIWGPPVLTTLREVSGIDRVRLRAYGGVEYMRWTTNSPDIQPLVTTSTAGTAQEDAGVLGLNSTSTLFGGELFEDQRNGGRYTGAIVLDGQQRWIVEAIYTTIGKDEIFYRADDTDASIVARPFYNSTLSEDDARLVVFPDVADGRVDITGATTFETFQIAFRRALGQTVGGGFADYTIGYRRADLGDTLQIFDVTNSLTGATAGTRFEVRDRFRTRNTFDGVDFGLVSRWCANDRLSIDLLGKLALGRGQSTVKVNGRTITRPPGGDRTGVDGGLLTQTTNIGTSRDSGFATLFEFGATLRYKFHPNVQGTLGYTFLTLSDVARVADQLDDAVNPSQFGGGTLVGDPRPIARHRTTDFTANGLRIGVQLSF